MTHETLDDICEAARRRERFTPHQRVQILRSMRVLAETGEITHETPETVVVQLVRERVEGVLPHDTRDPGWDWKEFALFVLRWLPYVLMLFL